MPLRLYYRPTYTANILHLFIYCQYRGFLPYRTRNSSSTAFFLPRTTEVLRALPLHPAAHTPAPCKQYTLLPRTQSTCTAVHLNRWAVCRSLSIIGSVWPHCFASRLLMASQPNKLVDRWLSRPPTKPPCVILLSAGPYHMQLAFVKTLPP